MVPDNSVLAVGVFHNVYNSPGIALSGSTACGSYTYAVSPSNKYQFTCNNAQGQAVQSGQQEWQCPDPHNAEGYSTVANRTNDTAPVCSQSTTMHCADPTATPDMSAGAAPNTCVCPAPTVDDGSHKHCGSPCTQYAGKSGGDYSWDTNIKVALGADGFAANAPASADRYICAGVPNAGAGSGGGCSVVMHPNMTFPGTTATGQYWVQSGPTTYTGSSCDPSTNGDGSTSATPTSSVPAGSSASNTVTASVAPCPVGQVQGTFNGTVMCQPAGVNSPVVSNGGSSSSTTTVNPDGSSGTTTTSKSTDASCSNGQCQTTTTITVTASSPGGGSPTSTTTQSTGTSSLGDFCRANPGNAVCGGGGGSGGGSDSFGGSCNAGFACDGDAVQCAIAQEQHQRDCTLFSQSDSDVAAGTAARTADVPGSFFSSASLSGVLPAMPTDSSCVFTDQPIMVGIMPVQLNLSQVCPYIAKIRALVVAFGALMFVLIVSGRKS